jgi:uncharacterized membrane protein
VIKAKRLTSDPGEAATLALAALFFLVCTWTSYVRWANFEYRTFDLAFYTQAIWQFIHGRFEVTVEPVPLLGNHVEPIVFLIAPLFAVFRHPMIFVVVQNAVLATMGPVGFDIGKSIGLKRSESALLAGALLVAPALGYIALHEFHPEALTAPLLLLMFRARLRGSLAQHWLWFVAVLACKENMAPLLAAYCAVHFILDWKRRPTELRAWYLWPLAVSILWFLVCTTVITPALNSGQIDYVGLYSQIGASTGDILIKAVTEPQRIGKALVHSISSGNLLWALLFPFLCLPLLKPRWLLIAAPVLLQHLLSWRSSEWNIYFHYAAPLLPLCWIATVEAVAEIQSWKLISATFQGSIPLLIFLACLAAQSWLGPVTEIASATSDWFSDRNDRARKSAFLSRIPAEASVVAPLPYVSHLAVREKLYSLHHILKGLKTLSRSTFEPPPPPDFVLIDYGDSSTFDASSGYYHPTMKMTDGRIIPSSDQRLHDFLKQRHWVSYSFDELTLLQQCERPIDYGSLRPTSGSVANLPGHTQLISITKSSDTASADRSLEIQMTWNLEHEREVFPWMYLRLTRSGDEKHFVLVRGLCAPEASTGAYSETWYITSLGKLPKGDYSLETIFVDNTKRVWNEMTGKGSSQSFLLSAPIPLGNLRIAMKKAGDR